MQKRLITWTLLTSSLLALGVWTLLGPPEPTGGPHLPLRSLAASVR
jgi:hypothetical protein